MIITSEQFAGTLKTKNELLHLKTFLLKYFEEIKVIGYFREQSELASSWYSQGLKFATTASFPDYLQSVQDGNPRFNIYNSAKLWSSVFGKQNMSFRLFDRNKLVSGDIRLDFLNLLGELGLSIDSKDIEMNSSGVNESLARLKGSAFRAVNEIVPFNQDASPGHQSNKQNKKLKEMLDQIEGLEMGRIFVKDPGDIQQRFEDSNNKFFREFLPGEKFQVSPPKTGSEQYLSIEDVEKLVYALTKNFLEHKVS